MNHHPVEHFHSNHDSIAHNTKRKRRDVEDATPPSPNQASTLGIVSHIPMMNAKPNVSPPQKQDMGNKKSTKPQTTNFQSLVPMAPKAPTKEISIPLNNVDQMKRTTINISIWNVFSAIPS